MHWVLTGMKVVFTLAELPQMLYCHPLAQDKIASFVFLPSGQFLLVFFFLPHFFLTCFFFPASLKAVSSKPVNQEVIAVQAG